MGTWTVDIKDFQSLKKVHLELAPGITCITGRSNIGKSAIIRAIDSALFNLGDDSMVRGGKRVYGVSISNGVHKALYCRDAKSSNEKTAYQFDDGTVQKKVGRNQLPEVAQMFNIRDVRMQNGTKVKINFWYQNDKPFLMDKTPGQLYEFLSLSSCDRYSKVLKIMAADMKVQAADINNITTEIDTLKVVNNRKQDFIDRNQGYDDLYVRIITAEQGRKEIQEEERIIQRIQELIRRIKGRKSQLDEVSKKLSALPLDSLRDSYFLVQKQDSDLRSMSYEFDRVKDLGSRIASKEGAYQEVQDNYSGVYDAIQSVSSGVQRASSEVLELDILNRLCGSCMRVKKRVLGIEDRIQEISSIEVPDVSLVQDRIQDIEQSIEGLRVLYRLGESVNQYQKKIQVKTEAVQQKVSSIAENDRQMQELKQRVGQCPFCGTVFEREN